MGQSCLQLTYEAQNVEHARYLHDALLPFGPILAALSAATPIHKGMLADWDMRWNLIRDSVDSRTEEERASASMPKSRYSGMNHYISDHTNFTKDELHDVPTPPIS